MEDGDLSGVLRAITEAAALPVERVNIWMFDRERTRVRCIQAYEHGDVVARAGIRAARAAPQGKSLGAPLP